MVKALAALTVLVTVGLAGCSPSPAPRPATTSASASPSATPAPAEQLRTLAALAAGARYRAVYRVTQPAHGRHHARHAEWRVWHTPAALRVDVVTGGVVSTQITTARRNYSCRRTAHDEFCLLVARGGRHESRAPVFVATTLFSADMRTLAGHSADYAVTAAPGGGPRCFLVRPRADAASPRVARGTYCFTSTGPVARVDYATGSTVDVRHLSEIAPPPSRFRPYSSPTPLP